MPLREAYRIAVSKGFKTIFAEGGGVRVSYDANKSISRSLRDSGFLVLPEIHGYHDINDDYWYSDTALKHVAGSLGAEYRPTGDFTIQDLQPLVLARERLAPTVCKCLRQVETNLQKQIVLARLGVAPSIVEMGSFTLLNIERVRLDRIRETVALRRRTDLFLYLRGLVHLPMKLGGQLNRLFSW